MSNFILKQIADTHWNIVLNRKKVGFARKLTSGENAGKFVCRINMRDIVIRSTLDAVLAMDYHDKELGVLPASLELSNRYALCPVSS